MVLTKTVGYCRYDDIHVYKDSLDADAFDKAVALFSRKFNVKDDICAGIEKIYCNGAKKPKAREYAFSNVFGTSTIEICYNPETRLLVAGSRDRHFVDEFVKLVDGTNNPGCPDVAAEEITALADTGNGGLFARICAVFGRFRKDKKYTKHASVLDVSPELYHILDAGEKNLIDEYESQLIDIQRYVMRKKIMALEVEKLNSVLETTAEKAKEYTVLGDKNIDIHEHYTELARMWKEIDYVPAG